MQSDWTIWQLKPEEPLTKSPSLESVVLTVARRTRSILGCCDILPVVVIVSMSNRANPEQVDSSPDLNRLSLDLNSYQVLSELSPIPDSTLPDFLDAVCCLSNVSLKISHQAGKFVIQKADTKLVAAVGSGRIAIPDLTNQIEQLTNQLFRLEHEIYRLTPHLPIAQNHAPEDETDFVKPDSSSLKLTIRACRHCLGPKPEQPDTEYTDSR